MLKPLTAEGRFECGLDDVVQGKVWAFVVGNPEGDKFPLGVALANEPGFIPVPLTWANADTYEEMAAHRDQLNEAEGLTPKQAAMIQASTMRRMSQRGT